MIDVKSHEFASFSFSLLSWLWSDTDYVKLLVVYSETILQ